MVAIAQPQVFNSPTLHAGAADILRFTTAGSVDDGKSTLIGRLLYDTKTVYEDQLVSIQKSGINRSDGPIDFSLLTDGLRAEREQGITIDVAYRYFSTPRRKFIIADTPGHEQYTRNMATGASTAQAAVVLIDATKGLLPQSRRHTYIATLLGIQDVIAAVNKMDLAGYREEVFREIAADFEKLARQLGIANVFAIPVSALNGDNIVTQSRKTPWFTGPTLLEYLEQLPARNNDHDAPLRLPVQYVIRPDSRFRGFAGQVASGTLHRGAKVVALPSGMKTRIKSITTFDGDRDEAEAGDSITVTLEDEIDLSRGDLLSEEGSVPQSSAQVVASLVWLHPQAGRPGDEYLLKHTTRTVRARLQEIQHRVNVNTLDQLPAAELQMNDIAAVRIATAQPLFFDPYRHNRTTGSFVLIDLLSNATVAAGMIEGSGDAGDSLESHTDAGLAGQLGNRGLESSEPAQKKQIAAAVWVGGRPSLAKKLELTALQQKWQVQLISGQEFSAAELKAIGTVLQRMGTIAIFSVAEDDRSLRRVIESIFGERFVFHAGTQMEDAHAETEILAWLQSVQEDRSQGSEKP
ncbi:MAG TPA: sulfate adenylyltransferase subunit CysN [Candidatus Angelobacter sp.]|nr:sulfate adenylyltransferase subunit CysN [Candidatus Angelobacter sp.]